MVTVEMAAALPVLMVLMLTGVSAVRASDLQTRCIDAARETARAAARGDPRATSLGHLALPGPADIVLRRGSTTVTAVVTIRFRPAGGHLPALTISAQATAAIEDVAAADLDPTPGRPP